MAYARAPAIYWPKEGAEVNRRIILRHRNWLVAVEYPDDGAQWDARRKAVYLAVEQQDRPALAAHGAELLAVMEEDSRAFGGILQRNIVGAWSWSDGTQAPEVRDSFYRDIWPNYRCRGNLHVEVLKRDVAGKCHHLPAGFDSPEELAADLAWVPDAAAGLDASGDHTGMRVLHASGQLTRAYAEPETGETTGARAIPQVYLVPLEEWDRRALRVCGAQWPCEAEPAILAKAQSLGWGQQPAA